MGTHPNAGVDRKIYTHFRVDLDAAASVWAVRTFVPGFEGAQVVFVPASWSGEELTDQDIAVDLPAGGRGLKGELDADGVQHSSFATIVARWASPEDRKALARVIQFVDAQDAHGSAVKHLAPGLDPEAAEVLASTGLNAVLRALQAHHPRNDGLVVERLGEILSGMLEAGRARIRAEAEADRAELVGGGLVAIVRNAREFATNGILFSRGVKAVVFDDSPNLGVLRADSVRTRMDHPAILRVVQAAGEESEWFRHPAGFLFARGSRKAPAKTPSKVDPRVLAEAVVQALTETGEAG